MYQLLLYSRGLGLTNNHNNDNHKTLHLSIKEKIRWRCKSKIVSLMLSMFCDTIPKKRPDKKSIPDYVAKKLDADKGAVLHVLHSLIHAERVHVKKINGKDSYFIGKNPLLDESHESTEAKDQNYDSFLKFLDGIKAPVKEAPSHALNIDTEDADSSRTSEIDFERPVSGNYVSIKDFKRLQVELDEFKRFSHREILSLKAQIANRPSNPSQQTKADPTEKDREALLRCLQDSIVSLERQLYDKQKIIEGLLERPRSEIKTVDGKKACLDDEVRFIPS